MKKTLWAIFHGFNLPDSTLQIQEKLLLTNKFPEVSGNHFLDLQRMKPESTIEQEKVIFEHGTPELEIQRRTH